MPPEPASQFKFGPVEGFLKELSKWIGRSEESLSKYNGKGAFHIQKIGGERFQVWFTTDGNYESVRKKAGVEAATHRMKPSETGKNL